MKIIRAQHLGMCFGVKDAIALAGSEAARQPVTVLGELVHNETVLRQLESAGVRFESDLNRVDTETVVVTAHGASEKRLARIRERGWRVLEATCPLVHFAHRSLRRLVDNGYHPVIIGRRDHVEVRGMTEDLECYDVILTETDVDRLATRARFGVVCQTTQPLERARVLVGRLRRRFPSAEVRFVDTICQPTKLRQKAVVDIARQSTVMVVIGGAHSNNTKELVSRSLEYCSRVHHVQTAADLREEWFRPDDIVGVTAGTSTPDATIEGVEARLRRFCSGARELPAASVDRVEVR